MRGDLARPEDSLKLVSVLPEEGASGVSTHLRSAASSGASSILVDIHIQTRTGVHSPYGAASRPPAEKSFDRPVFFDYRTGY